MTYKQADIIDRVNSTVLKIAGKIVVKFKMQMNEKGGFWVDVKTSLCSNQTIFGTSVKSDIDYVFNRIPKIQKNKDNREAIDKIIYDVLSFYN